RDKVENPWISLVSSSRRRMTQFFLARSRSKISGVAPLKFSWKTPNIDRISESDRSSRAMATLVNATVIDLSLECGKGQRLPILYPLNENMIGITQQHA